MSQLTFVQKIVQESFPQADQQTMATLASVINPFITNVANILNDGITLGDNFKAFIKSLTVTVDASGTPINPLTFQTGLGQPTKHVLVTRAVYTGTTPVYPTGAPFISYTDQSGTITVNNITGLPANQEFTLTVFGTV
jgi:hypothetical protein